MSETWSWPDSLDALVTAPKFHTLLFEDDATVAQIQCMSPIKGFMTIGDLKKVFGALFSLQQADAVVG